MEINIKEERGDLNFKVEWQSLDGRCCLKWHTKLTEAISHSKSLQDLGRTPQIWGRTEFK